jgi:hypothetical protein
LFSLPCPPFSLFLPPFLLPWAARERERDQAFPTHLCLSLIRLYECRI